MLTRVKNAVAWLQSGDPVQQRAACKTIRICGPAAAPAVPFMVEALPKASDRLCKALNAAFQAIGVHAVHALVPLLKSDDPNVRRKAVHALYFIGPAAVGASEALAALLPDPDRKVQIAVSDALKVIGYGATPAVLEFIEHPDPAVRGEAAWIARWSDTSKAYAALTKLLEDPNEDIRTTARYGLQGALVPPTIEERLEKALQELTGRAAPSRNRCDVLAEAGPAALAAVPFLISYLNCADANIRGAAYVAFRFIGAPAVPFLIDALQFDDAEFRRRFREFRAHVTLWTEDEIKFRCAIATSFVFIGPDAGEAVGVLSSWLKLGDPRLRQAAHSALCAIGEHAIPRLTALLDDKSSAVRSRVVSVFSDLGSHDARAILARVASADPSEGLRTQAERALQHCAFGV